MMSRLFFNWVKRYPLLAFFILAYFLSWVFTIPMIARTQGMITQPVPFSLHYLTAYGPMLAAIIITIICNGKAGVQELFGRIVKWRVGWSWILISTFSPLLLWLLAALAVYATAGSIPDLKLFGQVSYLPYLGICTWILWIFNSGMGEEIGWRGFALPRLQKKYSALKATLILAGCWIIWHFPFFFYLESYQEIGLAMFPVFAIGVAAGAIVFTWLYNSTQGSILMVILWHGSFNFITATQAGKGTAAAIASALVMVWAVLVIIIFKPANLSRSPKQVI